MEASEFDEWFEGEMPNSHKKVNKERIETAIYSCAEASWDHQQANIDEIQNKLDCHIEANSDLAKLSLEKQKKYNAMYNAFIVADDCRKEWHESYMSARKERDELQARINEALRHVVDHGGYDDLTHVINILKGNKDEN